MNQEKTGKFILEIRKEKNMTQRELADKIGVTDRAISKWENGRGMPDLSLMEPLCKELEISINELLSGERIEQKDYPKKSEENILMTIDYSNKKINKTKKKILISAGIIGTIILVILSMFLTDVNRMNSNKPVVFSTWGVKYAPPDNIADVQIQQAIDDYIIEINDNEITHYDNEKYFAAYRTYLVEAKNNELYYVYAWVLEESYYLDNNEIKQDIGSSMPYMFKIEKKNDRYEVTDSRTPRDGSLYARDMKAIFPYQVRQDMENVYNDGTVGKLKSDIQKQVKLYFHK